MEVAKEYTQDVAILVTSCDFYMECWAPFIHSIENFWPDCPWNIYIISNSHSIPSDKIIFLKLGPDKGWASNLKEALQRINAEFIIYLHEDFFLDRTVNNPEIEKHIRYIKDNNIEYLRLGSPFFDSYEIHGTGYAQSPPSKRYRLCLQAAIWRTRSLDKLLIKGYNAWQFEWDIEKYIKTNQFEIKSLVILSSGFPVMGISYVPDTAIHKGMWTQNGYQYLIDNGFEHILPKRIKEGWFITQIIHNRIMWLRPFGALLLRGLLRLKINI